jgi:hypothetical protein
MITNKHKLIGATAGAIVMSSLFAASAFAATTVVTPSDTQGWSTGDTRPGGAVNYVTDDSSPYGDGALQLTTDATNTAKAQYVKAASTTLSTVSELAYATKQVSGPTVAAASYQVAVDLNGAAAGGFTNLVYEPYWNGAVTQGNWQQWDVDAGQFWSSGSFSDGTCVVQSGAGGPPFYTLAALQAACPGAVVLGFGVNVGTYNPSYDVYVDGVNFNGDLYDFEMAPPQPTDKNQCKNNGWKTFSNPSFKNQGQCVSSVVSAK